MILLESVGKVSGQELYRAIIKKQRVLWGLLILSFCSWKVLSFFSQSSTHKCSITFAVFPDLALKTSRIKCKSRPFPSLLKYTVFTTDPIICVDNCLDIIRLTMLNVPELNQKQRLFNIRIWSVWSQQLNSRHTKIWATMTSEACILEHWVSWHTETKGENLLN